MGNEKKGEEAVECACDVIACARRTCDRVNPKRRDAPRSRTIKSNLISDFLSFDYYKLIKILVTFYYVCLNERLPTDDP